MTTRGVLRAAVMTALLALAACGGGSGGGDSGTPAAPGFELRLGSASIAALQDSDGLLLVHVERQAGFTGEIEVALADPPAGVGPAAVVVAAGDEARLRLRIAAGVAVGPLALTVRAASGDVTKTASLEVNVGAARPRSPALIQAALDAGQIDYGTSLVYRAYAVFGDVRLPEAFVGSGPAEEDAELFTDIERDRATLTAAVLDQLAPFLLRPDEPQSLFAAAGPNGRERPAAALPANDTCSGPVREWITARSTLHPVRVWTQCEGTVPTNNIARDNLLKVIDVVDKAYGRMVALMGPAVPDEYGDDAIDVYVVPATADAPRRGGDYEVEGVRGVCIAQKPFAGRTSSAYVMLPTWRLSEPDYQLTVIHELFHVLQYAHDWKVRGWWFREASATWASFHFNRESPVDPPDNAGLHAERFGGYQASADGLLSLADDHAYKSYIWPFFMEQKGGGPGLVGEAWKRLTSAADADQANNVLDFLFPFKDNIREFGLHNLNQPYLPGEPLPREQRHVGLDKAFPDLTVPGDLKVKFTPIAVGADASLKHDKPVEPLAVVYFEATVEDAAVRKVVFDLGGINVSGIDLAALVKIDGNWESQPRDLNGKSELKFCLDRPAEKLEEIVFFVGNYQKQVGATVAASLGVKSFAEPCGLVWAGTVTSKFLRADDISRFEQNTTAQVTFEFDDTATDLIGDEVPYRLRNGSYTLDALFDFFGRNPACRALSIASGAMIPEPRGRYDPLKPGSTAANLSLFPGDESTYVASIATAADTTVTDNCNDRNADVTTRGPATQPLWNMGGPLSVSADGRTIAGTYSLPQAPGTSFTWTWRLTLQDE